MDRFSGEHAEVVVVTDNKQMSVGAKRNLLVEAAKGDYVVFIDDDDMVEVEYVMELVAATASHADVIVFNAIRYENGNEDRMVNYDKDHGRDYSRLSTHYRLPNHLMCFKKSIAQQVKYEDISFGEDSAWARAVAPLIKTQHRIDKVLYEYWFDKDKTETQKR